MNGASYLFERAVGAVIKVMARYPVPPLAIVVVMVIVGSAGHALGLRAMPAEAGGRGAPGFGFAN
jgi:hypothetical protein